jgi:guanylate kinase
MEEVRFSVSLTTRARREGELEGVDYRFVSEEQFRERIAKGDFLEWAEVHGHLYGTSRRETESARNRGEDILLDVDVQGAASVRELVPDAILIFIMPPSFEVLEERLRGRRQDSPDMIATRLEEARREIGRYVDYHYVLVNESVNRTTKLFESIVLAERARTHLMSEQIRPILESFEQAKR